MAGLVPAIHALLSALSENVDARDKRGHDGYDGAGKYKGGDRPPP